MTPTVSVLMPVYNAERYVAEAIESVLTQTFADFEFIIIDDGSTDKSTSILRRFAEQDSRIHLVSRPNRGLVATLNEMLGLAHGEFVARMDADDIALPERLAIQVAYLREHPEVVAVGGMVDIIDEAGRFLGTGHPALDHDEIQDLALEGRAALNHPSVTIRREALAAVGGYREEMKHLEDLDLWLRLGERGRIVSRPEVVLKYRRHEKSKCEIYSVEQAEYAKLASDQACDRRGIERRFTATEPFRPADRRSRCDFVLSFGWAGFMRGDRRLGLVYGARAVGLMPWRLDGWRLLACAALKPMGSGV